MTETKLFRNRGTGFEEYFADAPVRPTDAEEERSSIYNPKRPFEERIESCIRRFRSGRRFNSELANFFAQYLFLGGVDCMQAQFNGVDTEELAHLTTDERRDATAIDYVYTHPADERFYNPSNPHWQVDFLAVAAGYFSEVVSTIAADDKHHGHLAISMVESFLRYVLYHDVCPEYADDVNRALDLCQLAREELPLVEACLSQFPGQFNLAATELYSPDTSSFVQPTGDVDHSLVFKATIALLGHGDAYEKLQNATSIYVVSELERDFEVISVERPSIQTVAYFRRLLSPLSTTPGIAPIGSAVLRPCIIDDGWYRPSQVRFAGCGDERLYLDDTILSLMKPGFKIRCIVCELNIGVKFIKKCQGIFPTFYLFLPQLLMKGYKPPVLNDRPPPSILDPFADEREAAKDVHDS